MMAVNVGRARPVAVLAAIAACGLLAAGCGSSGSSGGSSASSAPATASAPGSTSSASLGTPHPATGSPVVFGLLNLLSGPVTFPEVSEGEQAAAQYVNTYLGGINGHPIKIDVCATDGTPATSARCANQLLNDHPVAILGGADTGAAGSIPVWQRAGLAYLGGIPFTPVESNYVNGVIFDDVSVADNAAASVYAAKTLHAKTAAIIYTSDTQGTSVADGVLAPTMKNLGFTKVTKIAVPPTATDVTSAVAAAIGAHPDIVYIDDPNSCPQVLSSLKQLGSTAKVLGVDPCTAPAAIAAANGGASGMYYSSPVLAPDAGTTQSNLYLAVLKKYAPASIPIDSLTAMGFATVINVQAALAKFTTAQLTMPKILAAFRNGSNHPNFMAHSYTCDGKQLAGATSVCNIFQQIRQVQGTKIIVADPNWVTAGSYYKG
jgi:branched-chain amino acid transport system substrate-binding protein